MQICLQVKINVENSTKNHSVWDNVLRTSNVMGMWHSIKNIRRTGYANAVVDIMENKTNFAITVRQRHVQDRHTKVHKPAGVHIILRQVTLTALLVGSTLAVQRSISCH